MRDAAIFANSLWDAKAFGVGLVSLSLISGDCLDFKASTRLQRELTTREKEYIRQYGIVAVLHKMGNNYDVYFDTKDKLDTALTYEYILAGAMSFKLTPWKQPVKIKHCQKCLKFGHHDKWCRGTQVCLYCAEIGPTHDSKECPMLGTPDQHVCAECKKNELNSAHYCGDKDACGSYKMEYNYQMTVAGQTGKKQMTRNEFVDNIANGMVMQKWIACDKQFDGASKIRLHCLKEKINQSIVLKIKS